MKILVLPSWYPPHKGEFVQQQADALVDLGHDVTVLSIERVSPRNAIQWVWAWLSLCLSAFSVTQEGKLRVCRASVPGMPKFYSLYAELFAFKTKRVFAKLRRSLNYHPDVIHAHSLIWAGYAASKLSTQYKIAYLITEHRGRFINNEFVNRAEKKEMMLPQVRAGLLGASKVLCVSSKLVPYLASLSSETPIDVLANMVDVDRFTLKNKHGNDAHCRFICVAHVTPLKGHETLIQAFAKLQAAGESASLTIVGDGWYLQTIKALVSDLEVEKQVVFKGHLTQAQVQTELQQADVFVLPSQYEAFGLVYIEAMSVGLPVIATNTGGAIDFVNQKNGMLIEPNNADVLYQAMQTMCNKREEFDSESIASSIKTRFSTQAIVTQLDAQLAQISGKIDVSSR
ncbi:glycosyltransferase [Pseudoalteromonas sp. T1lg65]|uniref:glycosyltransferase n=1 Tax=Pseudoalteromonas sp. T1lg65 TaxID=2077101 RepID=UPI003F79392B